MSPRSCNQIPRSKIEYHQQQKGRSEENLNKELLNCSNLFDVVAINRIMCNKSFTGIKLAHLRSQISNQIVGLSQVAQTIENDELYHISKIIKKIYGQKYFKGIKVSIPENLDVDEILKNADTSNRELCNADLELIVHCI